MCIDVGFVCGGSVCVYAWSVNLVWLSFMAYQSLSVILCQILFLHIYQIHDL